MVNYDQPISDRRVIACDEHSVTFRYTPSGTKRAKTRLVSGQEFVRGFVQHTLPRGFQKIRYYGWMNPHSRMGLDEVKWLVWLFLGWTFWLASGRAPQPLGSFLAKSKPYLLGSLRVRLRQRAYRVDRSCFANSP